MSKATSEPRRPSGCLRAAQCRGSPKRSVMRSTNCHPSYDENASPNSSRDGTTVHDHVSCTRRAARAVRHDHSQPLASRTDPSLTTSLACASRAGMSSARAASRRQARRPTTWVDADRNGHDAAHPVRTVLREAGGVELTLQSAPAAVLLTQGGRLAGRRCGPRLMCYATATAQSRADFDSSGPAGDRRRDSTVD